MSRRLEERTARAVWRTDWFADYVGPVWVRGGSATDRGYVVATEKGRSLLFVSVFTGNVSEVRNQAQLPVYLGDDFRWTPIIPPGEIARRPA